MTFDKDKSIVDMENKQMYLSDLEMILALLRINSRVEVVNGSGVLSVAFLLLDMHAR